MLTPTFGSFHQLAWVTSDMERSLAVFREVYGIPSFLVTDQAFDAVVGGHSAFPHQQNLTHHRQSLPDTEATGDKPCAY